MIVRIHTALENLSSLGSVKKPRGDPQRGYAITVCPSARRAFQKRIP
jgi:hypothetical protein